MDFFAGLVSFFTDKKHSISSKVLGIIFIVATVFFINDLLGFTFYYSVNQKINQIEKIEKLKRDTLLSPENFVFLNRLEARLKDRENIVDRFINMFKETALNETGKLSVETSKTTNIDFEMNTSSKEKRVLIENNEDIDLRSRLWHTISSTFVFLFILIIVPFMPFITKDFSKGSLLAVIFIFVLTSGLVWLSQYLLGLIPLIRNTPIINYLINASTQIAIGYLLVRLIKNMK